jgi:site-specific DNA-methyltransferase (adenine-specific)
VRQAVLKWKAEGFDSSSLLTNGLRPDYQTGMGALFASDCLKVLPKIKDNVVDTVFADPPFNIGKLYRKNTDDRLPEDEYIAWCKDWASECVRVLKPGGSIFIYNLPKWNVLIGAHLIELGMEFRHWIAVEISACLPIPCLNLGRYLRFYWPDICEWLRNGDRRGEKRFRR